MCYLPVPSMCAGAKKAAEKAKDKVFEKLFRVHVRDQIGASESLSARTKRKRRDGFMMGWGVYRLSIHVHIDNQNPEYPESVWVSALSPTPSVTLRVGLSVL